MKATHSDKKRGGLGSMLFALVCYGSFHLSFVGVIAFLADAELVQTTINRTVSHGPQRSLPLAIAIDVVLVSLFGLQHSIMARQSFKRVWTRLIPPVAERSSYVLASVVCLVLVMVLWSPLEGELWHVSHPIAVGGLWVLQGVGWLLVLAATFAIDHFELFGLRQPWAALRGEDMPEPRFVTPRLYRLVRHPMQLGVIIGAYATPHMTVGHLIFALGMTVYIIIGLWFEERDLVGTFGEAYERYRERVPKLLPWPRGRSQ